jgi:drug/metabolite transporter (DMT)-like permease
MAVWGLNFSVMKVLTGSIDIQVLASLRMLVAAMTMSLFAGPRFAVLLRLHPGQLLRLGLCAVLMVYGNQLLLLAGMRLSTATNAAVIAALSPLIALGVAALMLRERLDARNLAGVLIGFGGVLAVILAKPGAALAAGGAGDLLLLLSVTAFALGGALVQQLALELDTLAITWATHVAGSLMLVVHVLAVSGYSAYRLTSLDGFTCALLLFSGAVSTGLGSLVWNNSISSIGVGRTTASLYWVPLFGVGFAVLAFGEVLTPWHAVGLAAVLAGTWIGTRARPPRHRAARGGVAPPPAEGR